MATIAMAPKGSKMAEDASKALRMAEKGRRGTPARPQTPSPRITPPDRPQRPAPSPALSASSSGSPRASAAEGIGQALLRPTEDPFEFDDAYEGSESGISDIVGAYGDLGIGTSQRWGSPPGPPPNIPLPPTPGDRGYSQGLKSPEAGDYLINGNMIGNVSSSLTRNRSQNLGRRDATFTGVPQDQNAVAIFWRGNRPQTFGLITHGVGAHGEDDTFPIEVQARHAQVVEMPHVWSGRVQKLTGRLGEPATRCEIEFGGYRGMTFFGVSYAFGNNGPVVMRSSPSDNQAGSPFLAHQVAPTTIMVTDSGGQRCLVGTEGVTNQRRLGVAKFYREFFEHAEQGGILAEDEKAIVATRDHHLLLDFF